MSQAPETLDGWWMLHDIRRIDWPRWRQLTTDVQQNIITEATAFFTQATEVTDAAEGASGLYHVIGQKGDLLQIHLRPELAELHALELRFNQLQLADYLLPAYSFLSVVELSRHAAGEGTKEQLMKNEYVQRRLKPQLPATEAVSFYAMSKKRDGQDNWYYLDAQRRRELMRDHGMIGRTYAGRITQIISGSSGLDDWEWGVTLFSDDALQFKKIVYEMRFDEASSRYGLFGPFFVGLTMLPAQLSDLFIGGA